jgi:hypothetical protein
MKPYRVDQRGFDHVLVGLAFAIIIALSGMYYLIAAHANAWKGELQSDLSTSLCIENMNISRTAGSIVLSNSCSGNTVQSWTVQGVGNNSQFLIKSAAANTCLDDPNGAISSPSAGNNTFVQTQPCRSSDHTQIWTWSGSGYHELKNAYSNGCIAISGGSITPHTRLVVYPCQNSANEQWHQAPLKASQ